MKRGTTPTLSFTTDTDLTSYERVILTFKCRGKTIDIEGERLSITPEGISLTLTQEETLTFIGTTNAQVRAVNAQGTAVASDICTVDFGPILKEGVIDV